MVVVESSGVKRTLSSVRAVIVVAAQRLLAPFLLCKFPFAAFGQSSVQDSHHGVLGAVVQGATHSAALAAPVQGFWAST